ncbi:sigma-54-dependent transcriptional regulator [Candidatus Laterigemmans baculatus]|uniref:sigma-54-dependent transcriptional regulator n=1 Tax=Candidatus Laterigemmans baculatus TaxID=2770505 RepID=UPI001F430050|nr:sigma-54 dependent transcriptional regulator [Candidatus Laterigemmans baculatus]
MSTSMASGDASPSTAPVVVIEDEASICWAFEQMLGEEGLRVLTASSAEEGLQLVERHAPALIVLDVRLPGMDGLTALPRFQQVGRGAPVIVITAFGDLRTAVDAVQGGAVDYLTKPFGLDRAREVCLAALAQHRSTASGLEADAAAAGQANQLIGKSPAMQEIYRQIAMVAESDLSVLITGETGSGKELIAAAIHAHSRRRERPYLPIAPVALNPTLIESELFGHVRGAFTGASESRDGLFGLAEGGTILLDEIGDLSPSIQVKLLRVLEQRQYTPVGDVRPRPCDVRIVAATHADFRQAIASGKFREDLYYRLAAVEIHAPPLRERLEDLEMLVQHFLKLAGHPAASEPVAANVLDELARRPWHGNVRELRNAIEQAAVLSRGRPLSVDRLPAPQRPVGDSSNAEPNALAAAVRAWTHAATEGTDGEPAGGVSDLHERFLAAVEPAMLEVVLERTGGNRAAAAELLGIHRGTLRERLRRYGIEP